MKESNDTDAPIVSTTTGSSAFIISSEPRDELICLVSDLIRLLSENPPGRESLVEQYLVRYCVQNDLCVERVPVTSDRANLIITLPGEKDNDPMAFTGHMDVVPVSSDERSRWKTDPYEPVVRDGRLTGRGAADMKGGLACVLLAMSEYARASIRPSRTVHLLVTCDEEDAMRGSRTLLKHPLVRKLSDLVVCEPTGMTLCRSSRGRTYGELVIRGKTAHGSRPGVGVNTIDIAADIIRSLRTLNADLSPLSSYWQPLAIQAGVEPGIIPDICRLRLDCRVMPTSSCDYEIARLVHVLDEIAATHHVRTDLLIEDKREPWITASDHRLVVRIHRLGSFEETTFSGSTDANILREAGLTPVIIGPGDLSDVHHEDEGVSLNDLERAFSLYKSLMR
ncbi:MAG: M20 family metallopeptidase [Clostridia bacterium]|jgi:acetylornithine deacetylase/succinyl-diaminopimelate desuccinylase-like protein|nr:M20 family metallopeptidase [Clostridia bacterium]MBP6161494.1 M20 family metallopeptidase [Clostridia bacterium]MBP6949795.1 M20 family metallopeptidase [Clostridia bacterium]